MTQAQLKAMLLFATLSLGSVFAEDAHPYNFNNFVWIATNETAVIRGENGATRLSNAFQLVQRILNEKARKGEIKNGESYQVKLTWKGKTFTRTVISHKESVYPILFPDKNP